MVLVVVASAGEVLKTRSQHFMIFRVRFVVYYISFIVILDHDNMSKNEDTLIMHDSLYIFSIRLNFVL